MKVIQYLDSNFHSKIENLVKENVVVDAVNKVVWNIICDVKERGDEAIIETCNKFDGAGFSNSGELLVDKKDLSNSIKNIDKDLLDALKFAYDRILSYHKKQLPKDFEYKDECGVILGNKWRSVESVCVYAPGGTASYPSSILMSAVPAIVAGVKNIVATVPSKNGKIDDSVLAACHICGIKKVYKAGGAAAIAAFAYGTDTIKKVDKIVGPGNSYVASAKKQLYGIVGIDMIAGPTDVLIICDGKTKKDWVAADLLSQLEHGVDSRAILITDSRTYADGVIDEIHNLKENLSRKEIIEKSLNNSYAVVVKDLIQDAPDIANYIAPEHLEIMMNDASEVVDKINNAGAIFIGKYTPEALGDYVAGPSHTLPTMSSAKFSSGLSVFDFLKRISVISCDKNSFAKISSAASIIARAEGFDAHKLSCEIRK